MLTFEQPLAAGTAVLEIDYDAPFAADLAGLYRVQEDGAWYAYTQFESTDARRAFPCFDEPGFKTAFDVTITAPVGLTALSNSPEARQRAPRDGFVTHEFETSRPLPSYLVAFAVGDFDVVAGQTSPFPIRAITTKGHAVRARLWPSRLRRRSSTSSASTSGSATRTRSSTSSPSRTSRQAPWRTPAW